MEATKRYGRREVEVITGLDGEKIQYWVRTHLLVPEERGGPGRSQAYQFSASDIITCQMVNLLLGYEGISRLRIQFALEALREKDKADQLRFFTDESWGVTQELVYVWSERKAPSPNILVKDGTLSDLKVAPVVNGDVKIPPITLDIAGRERAIVRLIYLGRVKLDALKTLKF